MGYLARHALLSPERRPELPRVVELRADVVAVGAPIAVHASWMNRLALDLKAPSFAWAPPPRASTWLPLPRPAAKGSRGKGRAPASKGDGLLATAEAIAGDG
jgi:hypothetical protein